MEAFGAKHYSDLSTQTDSNPDIRNWLQTSFKTQKQTIQKLENEIQSLKAQQAQTQSTDDSLKEWGTITTTVETINNGPIKITRDQMRDLIVKIHKRKGKLLTKQFQQHNFQDLGEVYKADFDYLASLELPRAKKVKLTEEEFQKLVVIDEKMEAMMVKFMNTETSQIQQEQIDDSSTIITYTSDQQTNTKDFVQSISQCKIHEIQLIHNEIFARLENKVKSALQSVSSEMSAAIKKSTESYQNLSATCPDCSGLVLRVDELEKKLVDKDHFICDQSSQIEEMKKTTIAKDKIITKAGFQVNTFQIVVLAQNTNRKYGNHFEQIKRMTEIETRLTKEISDDQSKISSLKSQIDEAERELRYETLNKNLTLKRVADLEIKLGQSSKQLKENESEISKLKTKIKNQAQSHNQLQQQWDNTYQNGCREVEFLRAQTNHLEMRLHTVCVDASQMENELRICRANAGQSVANSYRFQNEARKLKSQLAEEKKKAKDLIASDKPNSEYEMLLSEKDAIIAEYLSGKETK